MTDCKTDPCKTEPNVYIGIEDNNMYFFLRSEGLHTFIVSFGTNINLSNIMNISQFKRRFNTWKAYYMSDKVLASLITNNGVRWDDIRRYAQNNVPLESNEDKGCSIQ
jgi:hypothetical protein